MFQMLPFLLNNMLGGVNNNSPNNYQNNYSNNYNNGYVNNYNNMPKVGDAFSSFGTIFNQVFTTLINNEEIIDNIIDNVMNSDLVNDIIDGLDEMNLELKNYDDRYVIEGVLPGISKKDIDIDYKNEHIEVTVKMNQVFSNGSNTMVAFVQPGRDLKKNFYVPNIDTSKIKAVYNSDLLRVYLPKKTKIETNAEIVDVVDFTDAD